MSILMKTLDHWSTRLTTIPAAIECPVMKIVGRDHEPLVFIGPGHVDISGLNEITFRMFASAPDLGHALSCILRASQNRYETLDQFRLFATDYEGNEWACGWIRPQFQQQSGSGWLITGALRNLVTHSSASWVAPESGVELLFQPTLGVPLTESILTVSSIDGKETGRSWHVAQHILQALDTRITFFQAPSHDALWVTAPTSKMLMHPHAENWIGEPLRILLGQLAYPRLVARNFGNGSAHVQLRSSPRRFKHSGWVSLMATVPATYDEQFWDLYTKLLTMIGKAQNEKRHPNFESNPVTRFYEEIIQATQGSRWVQSMTLASAGEGLAKMIMTPAEQQPEFDDKDVSSLRTLIENWDGCDPLKKRVLGWFARFGEKSVQAFLRDLQNKGVLKDEQVQSWSKVRNAVMHGKMTSPWATEEDDQRLMALAGLVHCLTREVLKLSIRSS